MYLVCIRDVPYSSQDRSIFYCGFPQFVPANGWILSYYVTRRLSSRFFTIHHQ